MGGGSRCRFEWPIASFLLARSLYQSTDQIRDVIDRAILGTSECPNALIQYCSDFCRILVFDSVITTPASDCGSVFEEDERNGQHCHADKS